jgi:hypothetical protein
VSRDTTALPPLLVPQATYDGLEAHRAALESTLGPAVSRTWVFKQAVDVGLRDLLAELRERAGKPEEEETGAASDRGGSTFIAPSPPRGSRWTSQATARGASRRPAAGPRGAPTGFVRLTTMIVDRPFVDMIDEVRDAFDRMQPGLVASRAALIREALGRALAAYEEAHAQHERIRRVLEAQTGPFQPVSAQIPLAALLVPRERPAATVTTSRSQFQAKRPAARARARRTKRARARVSAGSGDSDDGEPPGPQPSTAPSVARRCS